MDLLILTEPEALTENEKSVLAYICTFFRENGYTISQNKLAQKFQSLESRILYILAELHRKGYVRLAGEGDLMGPRELSEAVRDYGRNQAREMGQCNGMDYDPYAGGEGALFAAFTAALGFLSDDQRRMVAQFAVRPENVALIEKKGLPELLRAA